VKLVFFGSPDFAVASLLALLNSKHEVLGVVTQPDRPAGRGLQLEPPAVKKALSGKNIPIIQPEKVNSSETYSFLETLKPDVLCVVAYGGFLGEHLLKTGKFPPINVHPSLLPDLRGAAPMQWAVLRGYKQTGVTTQFMVKAMDAGDILLQTTETIGPEENSKELQDRLRLVGGRLLVESLDKLELGQIVPKQQDASKATFAPLLTKEQGLVRWQDQDASTVHNLIRGLFPWPGAYTILNKKRIKLLRSKISKDSRTAEPGTLIWSEGQLLVACASGMLELLELQPEGRRAILPEEFVNGMKGSSSNLRFEVS
jgi:methionyl-tRNA formyltransferase